MNMLNRSYFQVLPSNIMLDIATDVIQLYFSLNGTVNNLSNNDVKRLFVLASICSAWRDVALSLICRKYTISTESLSQTPSILFKNNAYLEHARILDIHMDDYKLFGENTTNDSFECMWQNYLYFPNANIINAYLSDAGEAGASRQFGITRQLALRIKNMAPRAYKAHISYAGCFKTDDMGYWMGINSFTECLSKSSTAVRLNLGNHFRRFGSGLNTVENLASLDFEWNEKVADMLGILHACSDTLQELSIHGINTPDVSRIIIGENGCPVTYPYVLKLKLDGESDIKSSDRPVFGNVAPFPRLVKLWAEILYPFGDDVLFRGNSNTLRDLCLNLDQQSLSMINSGRIFAYGKYRQLNNVEIKSFIEDIDNSCYQVKQYMSFLQNIAPTVQRLRICDIDIAQGFIDLMPKTKLFKSIHTLCLCDIHLSLSDVFDVLKALPALQTLESGLVEIYPDTNRYILENLSQIYNKHNMVGRSFLKWKVSWGSVICVGSSALYAVALAGVCPRFQTVELPDCHMDEYLELIKGYVQSQRYTTWSVVIQDRVFSKPIGI